MPISGASFHQANDVFFSAPIIHDPGVHLTNPARDLGPADVVDFSQKGDDKAGFIGLIRLPAPGLPKLKGHHIVRYIEPVLVPNQALANKTRSATAGDVLTAEDLEGLNVQEQDLQIDLTLTAFPSSGVDPVSSKNRRPIAAILEELGFTLGGNDGMKVGIDTAGNVPHLVIYRAKANSQDPTSRVRPGHQLCASTAG